MRERIGVGEGQRDLRSIFRPRTMSEAPTKGELVSTVRGPDWLRRPWLKAAEAAGRVPRGTADQVRDLSWEQVREGVRAHNAGLAAELPGASRTIGMRAIAARGGAGPVHDTLVERLLSGNGRLTPMQQTVAIERAKLLGIDVNRVLGLTGGRGDELGPMADDAVAIADDAGRTVSSANHAGAAGDDLQRAVAEGFDTLMQFSEAERRQVMVDIGEQLGRSGAADEPVEVLARVIAETPDEELAPAMQRAFERFAARVGEGAAAAAASGTDEAASLADDAGRIADELSPVADDMARVADDVRPVSDDAGRVARDAATDAAAIADEAGRTAHDLVRRFVTIGHGIPTPYDEAIVYTARLEPYMLSFRDAVRTALRVT